MVSALYLALPATASAQMGGIGGMGGMGGMRGGMGGGMGRGGMRGGPPGRGSRKSPADMIKQRLHEANSLVFLLDHKKPLALTKPQEDSIKQYRKDVEQLQKPLFSSLKTVLGDGMARAPQGGPGGPGMRGGMGGRGGTARGTDPRDEGEEGPDGPGVGDVRFLPDTARALVARLEDIQQAYGDKARALLDPFQRQRADSIQSALLAEQRAKMQEQLERRRRG